MEWSDPGAAAGTDWRILDGYDGREVGTGGAASRTGAA